MRLLFSLAIFFVLLAASAQAADESYTFKMLVGSDDHILLQSEGAFISTSAFLYCNLRGDGQGNMVADVTSMVLVLGPNRPAELRADDIWPESTEPLEVIQPDGSLVELSSNNSGYNRKLTQGQFETLLAASEHTRVGEFDFYTYYPAANRLAVSVYTNGIAAPLIQFEQPLSTDDIGFMMQDGTAAVSSASPAAGSS